MTVAVVTTTSQCSHQTLSNNTQISAKQKKKKEKRKEKKLPTDAVVTSSLREKKEKKKERRGPGKTDGEYRKRAKRELTEFLMSKDSGLKNSEVLFLSSMGFSRQTNKQLNKRQKQRIENYTYEHPRKETKLCQRFVVILMIDQDSESKVNYGNKFRKELGLFSYYSCNN
ncbi:hypothetical protein WN51_10596 [Melipona quadrifasciata]|uniref:Uncharacterized protein n=1 Tax=Melipona quadrifasciata TaxID=166423 RepID=A0A0M9A737_9HYME|nr:hypothetical protein WN51_10596 [Melipona quadrifasciata]